MLPSVGQIGDSDWATFFLMLKPLLQFLSFILM